MKPRIIVDTFVLDYKIVKRTWFERLFTLPWTPWLSTKKVHKTRWIDIDTGYIVSQRTHDMLIGLEERN